MIHDFGLLNILSDVPAVLDALDQAGRQLFRISVAPSYFQEV